MIWIRVVRVIVLSSFCFFGALSLVSAQESDVLSFERRVDVGAVFSCEIRAESNLLLQRYFADGREQSQDEVRGIRLCGEMRVLEVNREGQVAVSSFLVESCSAQRGEGVVDLDLAGRRLKIDHRSKPLCKFSQHDGGASISSEQAEFLSLVFRPIPAQTMADLLGKEVPLEMDRPWELNKAGLFARFREHGLELQPEQFKSSAAVIGRELVAGVDCWVIELEALTRDVPGYQFVLEAKFMLPGDNLAPPLRIERLGREKITRKMPQDGGGFNVNIREIRIELTDSMVGEMIPVHRE